ncbi:4-hydroxy-tetrahydrodipicolinate reductase [Natronomonas sp. EA1]|uniref:4-hydroxy-tetrahydrodipicolinate reductase n=1 Tax=Natronomonas sp. EA1 TaxID=3421655 RepID=UPI003EB7C086
MRVAVAGATGRTGSEIVAEARERGHTVHALSREPVGEERDIAHLPAVLRDETDVLIDFTVPEATVDHVQVAAETGTPIVVGTTGFSEEGLDALSDAAESTPVLRASNFAPGVQALLRVVRAGVEALPEYDIEMTETHHNGKRDAPSGTANTVLNEIDAAREAALERVYGREGEQPREDGEVGVHVRRAGNVRGEHEVLLAGNDEVLTLTHRAESRRVFAAGAVDAAEWVREQDAGEYEFSETL